VNLNNNNNNNTIKKMSLNDHNLKRLIQSLSNYDTLPVRNKTKCRLKQLVAFSSSNDDSDNTFVLLVCVCCFCY
jgi:hypothetical protein